jgi:hypothetical protein
MFNAATKFLIFMPSCIFKYFLFSSQIKAFYVDFILPLENNLEKDTKVISLEQKKFTQLHKLRVESFSKANNNMKKNRKKKNNAEKELKVNFTLELQIRENAETFFCSFSAYKL